jgi:hypothetical protein
MPRRACEDDRAAVRGPGGEDVEPRVEWRGDASLTGRALAPGGGEPAGGESGALRGCAYLSQL